MLNQLRQARRFFNLFKTKEKVQFLVYAEGERVNKGNLGLMATLCQQLKEEPDA